MNPMNIEMPRRGFLTASAWAAGALLLADGTVLARPALANASAVELPERGLFDTAPGGSWTQAFLSGNGEYGAMLYGGPELERIVFNHHRFVLPNGTRDMTPPDLAPRLASVQAKALNGDFNGASAEFTEGWSLKWTQPFHPGYELRIEAPSMTAHDNYMRSTDFRSGEIRHSWSTAAGTWQRRMFVSRSSNVIVHELSAPAGASIDVDLSAETALPGAPDDVRYSVAATTSGRNGHLSVRGIYPDALGAYGFEGLTRASITGSGASISASGGRLAICKATRVILLTKLARYEAPGDWDSQPLKSRLGVLLTDYDALLRRHLPVHRALCDGSTFRLNVSDADRGLGASALVDRQSENRSSVDLALLEAMYDSGRYLFVSSSGILPPRLTGIWVGEWGGAWSDDFTTDANVNLQVAGGNMLFHGDVMKGYFDLVLGQLDHWRTNARNLYGARGFLAPTRTDGENGHMLHFEDGWAGHCWTGGADWMLYPLIEYCQVTGDDEFYRTTLAPVLMELALFYEDFLTHMDGDGKYVFVPSFSMENTPSSTGRELSINATGDIEAGRHALKVAIDAANALGVEQGAGEGVARWTEMLSRLPGYRLNGDDALAEWAWPGLTDRYNHRHISHLYGTWPLDEVTPDETRAVATASYRALVMRGDENMSGHGSLHRALAWARLKDGRGVYDNLRKILGENMVFDSLMTSHNPELHTYNADSAHAIPAILAESVVYTRPGVLELLPALPEQFASGELTGVRGRNRVLVESIAWDVPGHTVTASIVSAIDQTITLICRRGISSISVSGATEAGSELGLHARELALPAGTRVQIEIETLPTVCRLVNRASGSVIDVDGASTNDGAEVILWPWSGQQNQRWKIEVGYDGGYRFKCVHSDKVIEIPGSSASPGARADQWADSFSPNQWWRPVAAGDGWFRLVNVSSGLVLDTEDGASADGVHLVQSPGQSDAHTQHWRIDGL